uniref:Uncharacterized protein n=1 Tax=Parascaris univalens TaxID=6257 RepID=A0A915B2G0_PARUN
MRYKCSQYCDYSNESIGNSFAFMCCIALWVSVNDKSTVITCCIRQYVSNAWQ